MITKYSVVQYLPNPLSGERINLGVIAWGEGRIAARFIEDWRRVRAFGREDLGFLQGFVRKIENAVTDTPELPGLGDDTVDVARLEAIIGSWTHSIEFSEPRSSLKPPLEVLREVGPIYLVESPQRTRRARDRRAAAALVVRKVSEVLRQRRGQQAEDLIKRHHSISGRFDQHLFDVVVANRRKFFAAQGLSFETSLDSGLQKDVDSTAWAIDDVRKKRPTLPLGVLVLPPKAESDLFESAKRIFRGLNANVVLSEQEMGQWVEGVTTKLPVRIRPGVEQFPLNRSGSV